MANVNVPALTYQNFAASMTAQYAVICDNWPLEQFCSPSSLGSHTKLQVLYHAFETGTAHFWKLTEEEFQQWESERFNTALAQTITPHTNNSDTQWVRATEEMVVVLVYAMLCLYVHGIRP